MKDSALLGILEEGRRREREQTLFYRGLTGLAERVGDTVAADRLNALLADEQHHLSRLTARLLELGARPAELEARPAPDVGLDRWEAEARRRENDEVAWYEAAVAGVTDAATADTLGEILASERHHRDDLGGKWMPASPPGGGSGGEG